MMTIIKINSTKIQHLIGGSVSKNIYQFIFFNYNYSYVLLT